MTSTPKAIFLSKSFCFSPFARNTRISWSACPIQIFLLRQSLNITTRSSNATPIPYLSLPFSPSLPFSRISSSSSLSSSSTSAQAPTPLSPSLHPTFLIIKVHLYSYNYRQHHLYRPLSFLLKLISIPQYASQVRPQAPCLGHTL